MATSSELNLLTVKELASTAKELGVLGWHEMRKDELVRTLVGKSRSKQGADIVKKLLANAAKTNKAQKSSADNGKSESEAKDSSKKTVDKDKKRETPQRREKGHHDSNAPKAVAKPAIPLGKPAMELIRPSGDAQAQSRLVLMVRDPYWIQAYWEVNAKTLERAKVAMGQFWHTATPVLRLYRLESDGSTNPRRRHLRDIRIHGGVNNWYIDVSDPPSTFQLELGFISREKNFYPIASSNNVTTPLQQIRDDINRLDGNWKGVADDLGRVFKLSGGLESHNQDLKELFEEKLRQPMSAPLLSRFRASQLGGGSSEKPRRHFEFQIDADVVIHGKTDPSVQISIRSEPIPVDAEGNFTARFSLPEKRHVFPIDAESSDGVETQRVILAMERNTKILETLFHEHDEED